MLIIIAIISLQLMTSMLCLSAIAMRSSREPRALGYVPPFLPGLNRVTIKPNIRYEELVLDETRLEHNKPQGNSLDWSDKDAGYYSSKMVNKIV
jgi:hypothetical protein